MNLPTKCISIIVFVLLNSAALVSVSGQAGLSAISNNSGGVLSPEQAAYDVKSYDLDLRFNIEDHSIKGVLVVTARIVNSIDKFVLDLDKPLTVDSVSLIIGKNQTALAFERQAGKVVIAFPKTQEQGKTVIVRVAYGGKPKVAARPPWDGGLIWSKTSDGQPWIAVACETEGADLWFPVKDHPSDEPETVSLHYTVPDNLVAAGNGKLQSVVKHPDGTQTFNWFVSQPINNYCITFAIAPYKLIEDKVQSISGMMIPIQFYVLPEHFDKGQSLVDLTKKYVAFFEAYLGPYPFRADKIGIVETPHLGMEHQTLIAYGNNFKYNKNGHDWLMFHEFGHEWWGNLVTAGDWKDIWIHEGFQSFMDTLYIEKTIDKDAYFKAMKNRYKNLRNVRAVAPREPQTSFEMSYLPPDYKVGNEDDYNKGALFLSTLRYLIGDDAFFRSLRRMTYPDPKTEKVTNGKQTRLVTTDDFLRIAERESGKKLNWLFEVYVRQPGLPKLISETKDSLLMLRWETPNNLPFPMPVEVRIGNETKRVEMTNGTATIALPAAAQYFVDPNDVILKAQKPL